MNMENKDCCVGLLIKEKQNEVLQDLYDVFGVCLDTHYENGVDDDFYEGFDSAIRLLEVFAEINNFELVVHDDL